MKLYAGIFGNNQKKKLVKKKEFLFVSILNILTLKKKRWGEKLRNDFRILLLKNNW